MKRVAVFLPFVLTCCVALPNAATSDRQTTAQVQKGRRSTCSVTLSTVVKGFTDPGEAKIVAVALLDGCTTNEVHWSVDPPEASAWTYTAPDYATLINGPLSPMSVPGKYVRVVQLGYTGPQCMEATIEGATAKVTLNGPAKASCK